MNPAANADHRPQTTDIVRAGAPETADADGADDADAEVAIHSTAAENATEAWEVTI